MNNIVPLLIFGLIGIGIGLALGVLFCSWRNDGKLEETKRPEKQAVTTSFPQKTPPTSKVQTVTTEKEEYTEAPNMNIVDVMARAIQPKKSSFEEPPKSITTQIDEILQEMLKESGRENQAIRLVEDPGGGVIVMVGLEHYDGVDAVPDPEIRSLIRSAVAEWERRESIEDQLA